MDLCAETPISGLQEMRKGTLMAFERADLEIRMRQYFDEQLDWEEVVAEESDQTKNGGPSTRRKRE